MGCSIPQVDFSFPCVMEFIQGVRNNDPLVISLRRAATILLATTQNFTPAEGISITLENQDFETLAAEVEGSVVMNAEEQSIPWELIFQLVMWWLQNRKKG